MSKTKSKRKQNRARRKAARKEQQINDWEITLVEQEKFTTRAERIARPEAGRIHPRDRTAFDQDDNPDPLLLQLNEDQVTTYRDMFAGDAKIRAAWQRKSFAVTSQEWTVTPAEAMEPETVKVPDPSKPGNMIEIKNPLRELEEQTNLEHAEFVNWTLTHFDVEREIVSVDDNGEEARRRVLTPTSFRTGLDDMCTAALNGYSIVETVIEPVKEGRWRDKLGLAALKGKDPILYTLALDDFGNIWGINFGDSPDNPDEVLDLDRFIVTSYMGFYSNPYGNSDLQAIFGAYETKRMVKKLWAIAAERFALPIPMAKAALKTPQANRTAMLDIMRNMRNDFAIIIPEGFDLQFLEAAFTTGSSDIFSNLLDWLDKEIMTAIEGAFLHATEGTLTGARNMGLVHRDTTSLFAERLSHLVQDVINTQLIPRLIRLNFAGVSSFPTFSFVEPDEEDLQRDMAVQTAALANGMELKKAEAYERAGYTMPDKDDEVLAPIIPPAAPVAPGVGF